VVEAVEVLSSWVVVEAVEVLSCPSEEGAEVEVGVSSPYRTPHANNESL